MKTVTVSTQEKGLATLLKRARRGGLILRSSEGREFILAEISDFNREIELARRNKKLMTLLTKRASQKKTIPLAEVKARLHL